MADDGGDLSPRPFVRERNLSNRNFNRSSARRRFSTESRSSIESTSQIDSSSKRTDNSARGSAKRNFNLNMALPQNQLQLPNTPEISETPESPLTPDPALLDVRRKVLHFETLQFEHGFSYKTGNYHLRNMPVKSGSGGPMRVLPSPHNPMSINEERSEEEVDNLSDIAADETDSLEGSYSLSDNNTTTAPDINGRSSPISISAVSLNVVETSSSTEKLRRTLSQTKNELLTTETEQNITKDFARNYRTTPRPKTEVNETKNQTLIEKFHSLRVDQPLDNEESEDCLLRDRSKQFVQPILEELIKTEESYVENLMIGIENYGSIFQRQDLPIGLRGKKYVLLGNVEQIAEFHRDEFLPMLKRNQNDLKSLYDEFLELIEQNCFYSYVIFTMNKQRSLKLCDIYKNYFKLIQNELDDKLGINSFLVQPIQRMARYPLLLDQFITTFFKNRSSVDKAVLSSCCRLEKRFRTLLVTTNESEVINDIVDCNEFNVFYQGKFRKVSEFQVYDYTLRRSYRAKVFIFDKCIIYTEKKGKNLIFHGRYPCEHVGIVAKPKTFTLFYDRRKQQECDFNGDPALIELWLDLIRDMIHSFVAEERAKLQELYSRENDHILRQPPSLSLFRDSNRFSADSGIGNIWVMPKPETDEATAINNRTTWYTVS